MTSDSSAFTQKGSEGQLTPSELDTLLDLPLICHLSCLDDRGWPYVVPVWFEWDGKGFWIIPRKRSAWAEYLQENDRVALSIDDAESGRRVVCQGTARLVEEPNVGGRWVEIAERMVVRYQGEEGLVYLNATLNQPRWLYYVVPERLITWGGSGWHERYAK